MLHLTLNKYSKISNSWIGFRSNRIVTNYSIQTKILNIRIALTTVPVHDLMHFISKDIYVWCHRCVTFSKIRL